MTMLSQRAAPRRKRRLLVLFSIGVATVVIPGSSAFFVPSPTFRTTRIAANAVSKNKYQDEENPMDDEALLQTVTREQLVDLCHQLDVSTEGTKQALLKRLRDHANQQAERDRQLVKERAARVEQGSDDAKERYEIVADDVWDDVSDGVDDDGFFYFSLPDGKNQEPGVPKTKKEQAQPISNTVITAPPPPMETNENGERVVTVYSSTETNDLTGIAAAQPGQSAYSTDNLMSAGSNPSGGNQPWDLESSNKKSQTSTKEIDEAREAVTDLVQLLLAMTGAPAFASMDEDDLMERIPSYVPNKKAGFVGFNPSKVPTELLTTSSKYLRTARGQVLNEVIRRFELQAIGQDGMAGDNAEKGGGHYREVAKVGSFLDGYRRAEVRRLARETTAMLLDKLVLEGIEGLDMTLAAMSRGSDDTAEYAGELNDSLLDYLSDAIRQQQKKVDQVVTRPEEIAIPSIVEEIDNVDALWRMEMDEDGNAMESIDPNDPNVQTVLQDAYAKSKVTALQQRRSIPESAPEQLLLLLTLLRERIKAEAAFSPDEKGRNLRLLAYCLKTPTDEERERLILKELGNSIDRLDSFLELVASSIEYGESTSYQLQPAKKSFLDVGQLKSIKRIAKLLRNRQSGKIAGVSNRSRG